MHVCVCVCDRGCDVADQEDYIPLFDVFDMSSLCNSTANLICFGSELLKTMHKFMQVHK